MLLIETKILSIVKKGIEIILISWIRVFKILYIKNLYSAIDKKCSNVQYIFKTKYNNNKKNNTISKILKTLNWIFYSHPVRISKIVYSWRFIERLLQRNRIGLFVFVYMFLKRDPSSRAM